jgi:hypothetical protein
MRPFKTLSLACTLCVAGFVAPSFSACAKPDRDVFVGDGGSDSSGSSNNAAPAAVASSSSSGAGGQGGSGGCGSGAGGTPCTTGEMEACFSGPDTARNKGTCKDGVHTCDACGEWGPCMGEVLPAAEMCDNMDNDCNGVADNGVSGATCSTGQPGLCSSGTQTCMMGSFTCVPIVLPATEICDAQDNDCDGQTDENNPCPPPEQCVGGFCTP